MRDITSAHFPLGLTPLALMSALMVSLPVWAQGGTESSQPTDFDVQALKARGIDPAMAEWFREAPRFMPGTTEVKLTVNGEGRGKVRLQFGNNGQLCTDTALLKQAGLHTPPAFSDKMECFDLQSAWPQASVTLDPGEARVDLVVPQEAVNASNEASGNWNHGGFAGMLNYDAQYMDSAGAISGMNFMQLGSEAGFNLSDWIVRSRQVFTRFNQTDNLHHQAAYVQRSFTGAKKVLQAGQINLSNSMFGTGQVLGFQLTPEMALQNDRGGPGLVEGIAETQSVVEIRQSGVPIYTTTVPAGPFRLQNFPMLNTRSDLAVTITGSNGSTRQFIVPASAFLLKGHAITPGWSVGVGKLAQQGSNEAPLVSTLSNGWGITPYTSINAGLLGSTLYRAVATGIDSQVFDSTLLTLQSTVAQDVKHGDSGIHSTAAVSHSLTERVSLNANVAGQSSGYREMSDALQSERRATAGGSRHQFGSGMSWANDMLGVFSLSLARSYAFDGDSSTYLRGSWSRSFGRAFASASVDRDNGSRSRAAESRVYLSLNIPFGEASSVSSYLSQSSKSGRAGVRYSTRSSQDRGWSLASEQDFRNRRTSSTASMDMVTPVSQLNGSVSSDSNNYTSWSARATGAVVAHNHGVSLTPYNVGDTFGVAKVGKESGVRIETPSGPAWTDGRGYAVLPSLNSYRRSAIEVDTRSLKKNVDISNAWNETEAARGSVNYINFDVVRTRRVLVDVKDAASTALPHGASVFDAKGNFITVVGDKGSVFIPDAEGVGRMDVQSSGITLCSFSLTLPEKSQSNELYETASAICR